MFKEQNGNRFSLTDNLSAHKLIQRIRECEGGSQAKGDQVRTRQTFQQGYVSDPIRRRNGVVFVIRYRIRDASGKWQHRSETLHGMSGKKAARGVLEQRLREASNRNPETSELTVHEFVDAYWLPYLNRKAAKPSTRKGYESGLKLHVFPQLGDVKLVDVAPLHIEELLKTRIEAGLSPKSVRNLVTLLQSIFSLAVDNDLIGRSPVRDRHKPTIRREEKPTWKPEQVRQIIESVPETYRCLFTCTALTGARLGEVLGLQWKCVDLDRGNMEIRQSLWNGQLVPPKTPGSVRSIYFGQHLRLVLTEQRQRSLHSSPEDFVFSKPDGSPHNPDVLRRDVLYPALDRLGIPRSTRCAGFHTFRHSAASIVNAQTGNLKLVQKFLGHTNFGTTADVYTHTAADEDRDATIALERAIYGDLFPSVPRNANKNSPTVVN